MSRLDELKAMSKAEIDRIIAERVMGWPAKAKFILTGCQWVNSDCPSHIPPGDWHPSTDHNDAATVRAEIEQRGLTGMFAEQLLDVALPNTGIEAFESTNLFKLINATPRETCIAALLTVGV